MNDFMKQSRADGLYLSLVVLYVLRTRRELVRSTRRKGSQGSLQQ